MTVSACMIVGKDFVDLRRCLHSLTEKVDEVCIVWTGKDTASGLLRQNRLSGYTVKQAWTDDFSAARNASIALATSDFWFYIDADEALEGDIRAACSLTPPEIDGVWLMVNNLSMDDGQTGEIGSVASQFRLVRNRIGARFEGRIHEQIVLPDRLPVLAETVGVSITHWGYLPERMKGKHIRNLTLLRKAIADEPENPYNFFQLGIQHIAMQDHNQAFEAYWTAIKLWGVDKPADPYVPAMFSSAIFAALQSKQNELAVTIAAVAPSEAFTPEYFYYTAQAALELGLTEDAHDLLCRGAVALPDPAWHDPNTATRIEVALEKMG